MNIKPGLLPGLFFLTQFILSKSFPGENMILIYRADF